jgi:hypothetical protein
MEHAIAKRAARLECSTKAIIRNGNLLTLDIACGMMALQGAATVSGSIAYQADLTMTMGDGSTAKTNHSVTESDWIGPCKPGEQPLD